MPRSYYGICGYEELARFVATIPPKMDFWGIRLPREKNWTLGQARSHAESFIHPLWVNRRDLICERPYYSRLFCIQELPFLATI